MTLRFSRLLMSFEATLFGTARNTLSRSVPSLVSTRTMSLPSLASGGKYSPERSISPLASSQASRNARWKLATAGPSTWMWVSRQPTFALFGTPSPPLLVMPPPLLLAPSLLPPRPAGEALAYSSMMLMPPVKAILPSTTRSLR